MKRLDEIISSIAELSHEDLQAWIHEELVRPSEHQGTFLFDDQECARVQLICTLHYDMDVETNTLPIVMDLIDEVHEHRRQLRKLSNAILAQNADVRTAVLALLTDEKNR